MTASTTSRKGNVAASVNKSKYGGTGGTIYASARSRSNILSSASKRSVTQAEKVVAKPPVQVCDIVTRKNLTFDCFVSMMIL